VSKREESKREREKRKTDRQLWALKVFSSNGLGWLNSGSLVGLRRTGNGFLLGLRFSLKDSSYDSSI
jgi:hypothetical protein